MLRVNVKCFKPVTQAGHSPIHLVIIGLKLQFRPAREMMRPSGLNIMAGIAADTKEVVVEIVALECEAVGVSAKVGPKAGTDALASIWHIRSGTARQTFAIITIGVNAIGAARSEEHTSELQSLMRISYAV